MSRTVPRPLIIWGASTVIGSISLLAIAFAAVAYLQRSGHWSRDQVALWGPVVVVSVGLLCCAGSLIASRFVFRRLIAQLGEQRSAAAQSEEPSATDVESRR